MKSQLLTLNKVSEIEFSLESKFNGKYIGKFIMDIDGYFYYEAVKVRDGYWSQELLKELATLLEDINKPHNDRVARDLERYAAENLKPIHDRDFPIM